jgi:hypothetical protein
MSKIYVVLTCVICLSTLASQSQVLKKFQGNYEEGVATYSYYEKDFNRIYEGSFTYSKYDRERKQTITASGQYHNNLKQGHWKYTFTPRLFIKPRLETVEGLYDKGKKVGEWTDIFLTKNSKELKIVKRSIVNFKNDQLIGHFSFQYNSDLLYSTYASMFAEGSFDNYSKIDGLVKMNYMRAPKSDKYEVLSKFRRGVLFWYIERDLSTGEILQKTDNTLLIDMVFKYTKLDSVLNLPDTIDKSIEYQGNNYRVYTDIGYSGKYEGLNILGMGIKYWDGRRNWSFGESFYDNNPAALISNGNDDVISINHIVIIADLY